MNKKFHIYLIGDIEFEELVADVYYDNWSVATISQEKGEDLMEVKINEVNEGDVNRSIPLNDFIEALLLAKSKLIASKHLSDND